MLFYLNLFFLKIETLNNNNSLEKREKRIEITYAVVMLKRKGEGQDRSESCCLCVELVRS